MLDFDKIMLAQDIDLWAGHVETLTEGSFGQWAICQPWIYREWQDLGGES